MRSFRKVLIHSAAGMHDLPAPFSFNSLVYLHESIVCLIACYGLELYLYRYNLCRLLKYPIPIMRQTINFINLFIQNVRFRNKDLLLQIKNTFCCLRSPLWTWWVGELSGCQIYDLFLVVSD